MTCQACLERGKTWNGSDPKCAFESGRFSADNWNCATMNNLRDMVEEDIAWSDDQYYAFIPTTGTAKFLYLSWYKQRGCTEHAYLVIYGEPPKLPTETDCRRIIEKEPVL